jgi:pimeloyl-ACP methyl ester carboxylesterase
LVGHSRAGFTVALYAAQHPDEVAGLVLVDAPHPEDYPAYLEQLPCPTPEEPEHIQRLRRFYAGGYQDPARNSEGLDVAASCRQVQQIHSLGTLPLIVLTAGGLLREPLLGPVLGQRFHQVHVALGYRWASLSTQGRHQVVESSDHQMQAEVPDIVIEAIQTVIQRARTAHRVEQ